MRSKLYILILLIGILMLAGCAQMTGNVSTSFHVKRIEADGVETVIDYKSFGDKQNIEGLQVENLLGANVKVDSRDQEGSLNTELFKALMQQVNQMMNLYTSLNSPVPNIQNE